MYPQVFKDFTSFRAKYDVLVETVETAVENVEFKVPRVLRQPT